MNILFLTLIDFDSIEEKGIYTDLMREFRKNNHSLFIVSPIERRKNQGTKLISGDNVKILKLRVGNIQKTSLIEKGISTLTLETKVTSAIRRYFSDVKFDLVLYSTPPITMQKAVNYVRRRDNAKSYLLLKDIFPQNAVDLGLLGKSGLKGNLYRYFRQKEVGLYKDSDFIGCMSQANVDYLVTNNPQIDSKTIEVCPNSIEPGDVKLSTFEKEQIRTKFEIPIDSTVFIFGGNLGKPQGVDFLIECIKLNEGNINSFILISGSGTEFDKVKKYFDTAKPRNSKLLSVLDKTEYETLVASCDVGLIFLDKGFTIPNFPSRMLSYMQASKPILAATDKNTDIGKILLEGRFGHWCESTDARKFNELVNLITYERDFVEKGMNARRYLENHYHVRHSYEIIMKHFAEN